MRNTIVAAALAALFATPALAQSETPTGTASVPLEELLRLHRAVDSARTERPVRPPVPSVVEKLELAGLLLDDAAELSVHVDAQVFDEGWTVLPLLRKDALLHVLALPRLESGTLSISGGSVALVTQKPGSYAFDATVRLQARAEGGRRSARLAIGAATLSTLKLKYDPAMFKLEAKNAVEQADGALLFPEEGVFAFSWEARVPAIARKAQEAQEAPRPAIEAVVERAHASIVSTLAGRRIVRVLYELKLEGTRPLSVAIPEGYVLERVFVNGAARQLAAEGGTLKLDVAPQRAGDARGRLELLLGEEPGRFKLSGALRFVLPAPSWRTDEYAVELHLPEVFNYKWRGGSLSPCTSPATPAEFVSQLPTPGKPLCLRQSLVFEPPTAEISYDVDLTGKYWAGR